MNIDDIFPSVTTTQTQHYQLGWTYLNLFSLIFIAIWSFVSIIAIYYLWYSFNLFQIEIQDITFELIDFHTNDIETKPREIVRLINTHDDTSLRAIRTV
jgi:hypothetical protein